MAYPSAHRAEWNQGYYVHPPSAPIATRTKISALLNDDDSNVTGFGGHYPATARSVSNHMAHSAHSGSQYAATNNITKSTLLSEQQSTRSLNSAYMYHANESLPAYSTYASDDEKIYSRHGRGIVDRHAFESGGSVEEKSARSKQAAFGKSRDDVKLEKGSFSILNSHTGNSHVHSTPPATISSSAFSAGKSHIMSFAPSQQQAPFTSTSTSSTASNVNDDDDDGKSDVYGRQFRDNSVSSHDTPTTSLGWLRDEAHQPVTFQRDRNRAAATKCRAKSKAAISKLEEDERAVTEEHSALSAQKVELVDEVLSLRMELIRHGHCVGNDNIQNYLNNAACVIGDSGGRNMFWGPDGSGIENSTSTPVDGSPIQQGSKKRSLKSHQT
ncbi:hypothetical protein SEPCBS57363_004655 [Sporothrix epigloea]|uniref:BZIP domain-containing protein n=1 Tax=Sporothrix epigloea TaxID=1892477 RepID=A0ABP0DT59_9PEZI